MLVPPSLSSSLRPQTSGGIVCHQPFTLDPERLIPPPISGTVPTPIVPLAERRERRPTVTRADAPAWPLPAADVTVAVTNTTRTEGLAGVAEEEEDEEKERRRRSRASIRASRSVPMLRKIAQLQHDEPMPTHATTQTLGRHDLIAAQLALKSALQDAAGEPLFLDDENWEDDIDYCYEHDANADFEYEWSRPSVDLSRTFESFMPARETIDRTILSAAGSSSYLGVTPKLNTDVPALSPASQLSSIPDTSEAATPTGPASRSLDLARPDLADLIPHGLQPNHFTVDQFEFSHERHDSAEADAAAAAATGLAAPEAHPHKTRSRSSTVTTVAYTDDGGDARSVFDVADRHISISSNQTSFTRYTSGTGSIQHRSSWKRHLEEANATASLGGDRPATPMRSQTPSGHLSPEPACSPWVGSASPMPTGRKSADHYRSPGHLSRASESSPAVARDQAPKRRQRARTMTGSAPGTPAPAQYGLFPRTSPKNRV
jgi:hypothetical protein